MGDDLARLTETHVVTNHVSEQHGGLMPRELIGIMTSAPLACFPCCSVHLFGYKCSETNYLV